MRGHDNISLHVAGKLFNRWIGYSISNNIYSPDSKFNFKAAKLETTINKGDTAFLKINDSKVMSVVIDDVTPEWNQDGLFFNIDGRDYMGLVQDQYIEKWKTYSGKTLKYIAEEILSDVPIVSKKEILFQDGVDKLNVVGDIALPEPGQTSFDFLKAIASSRGVQFYNAPDGTFVFGKPKNRGESKYFITVKKDGSGDFKSFFPGKSGRAKKSSRKHYKTIIVIGENNEEGTNFKKVFTDSTAPIDKTLVVVRNDSTAIDACGKNLISQQRYESLNVNYIHAQHNQNGNVFLVNNFATIKDQALNVSGNFLLYGAGYNLSKKDGPSSNLTFGIPGEIIWTLHLFF